MLDIAHVTQMLRKEVFCTCVCIPKSLTNKMILADLSDSQAEDL